MKNILQAWGANPALIAAAEELLTYDAKSAHYQHIQALLEWDYEVNMPSSGMESRAEQMVLIKGLHHESITHHRVVELLYELGVDEGNVLGDESLPQSVRCWLRAKYRQWKRTSSIPPALLEELVKTSAYAKPAWLASRETNDYGVFAPHLTHIVQLCRNIADCVGYEDSPYDALLAEYEPGVTTAQLNNLFTPVAQRLMPMFAQLCTHERIRERSNPVPPLPHVAVDIQRKLCAHIAAHHGYTAQVGHLGSSVHPFCSTVGWRDTRITTRYAEPDMYHAISSLLHEMGHAFYELGIDAHYAHTVCADGASYGIHESQSRFLENVIGRSEAFWEYWYPIVTTQIPDMKAVPKDTFMRHILQVRNTPIRVEADEVGYILHIIIRFEIEKALIEQSLSVDELPHVWNEKYQHYLGITPTHHAEGALQDIHWVDGSFGYFPSYALGTMYAASLHKELALAQPNYEAALQQGSMQEIRTWLGTRVHQYGAAKLPHELITLSSEAFFEYLASRYPVS